MQSMQLLQLSPDLHGTNVANKEGKIVTHVMKKKESGARETIHGSKHLYFSFSPFGTSRNAV